jgi:hypothetical protein
MARRKKDKQADPKTDLPLVEVCPEDFEPYSECEQRLTDEQIKAIRNMPYFRACLLRREGKWSAEEEAAFLNGVSCAFFACCCQDRLPAMWWLDAMPLLDRLAFLKARGHLEKGA